MMAIMHAEVSWHVVCDPLLQAGSFVQGLSRVLRASFLGIALLWLSLLGALLFPFVLFLLLSLLIFV